MEAVKTTFNAPEVKLHFLDYWRIIRVRKTVIIAVFLLVVITTTLVTFILPESFSSTVRIRVDKDISDVNAWGEQRSISQFDPYWIQTEFETIQSKLILHQVITNLVLNKKWAEKLKEGSEPLPMDFTYAMLKRQVDVSQTRNTSLIEIRVFDRDKYEAAEVANEIAKVYRETRFSQKRMITEGGIRTLKAQYDDHDKKFRDKQAEVDRMKEELKIPDVELGITYYASSSTPEPEVLRKLQTSLIDAQAKYASIYTLYTNLAGLSSNELSRALITASADTSLSTLMQDLFQQEQELAKQLEIYSGEHPDVKRTQLVLEKVRIQISERVQGIMDGLKTRVASGKAEVDFLGGEVNKAKDNDIKAAIARRPYFQAKRDLDSLGLIREKLAIRIIQEEVENAIPKSSIVEIIDKAEPSYKAVRPNKPMNIALGVIVGLAIGVGLAFFIEYLDTSVKTIDDVERALQAPVLAVIPQNVGSLIEEGPDSPHAEAYRVLRTNILFSQKDPKLNTITIVSGGAGEGKSTTIFNLATVFAQNGQRVLIVDSDLRRPSIHKMLSVSNSIGLTNYLLKQNTLEEVIQTTPLTTLDFMPSGKLPSSSMGVLSSAQMKELIRELKRRYDFVFFDSPPIMGVSDASILSSEVDMVLQVIQYRRYPQPMTIRAKQMIEKVGGNLLGIVLNNINMASDENYYYYSGYYYDYYSKSEDAEADKGEAKGKKAGAETERVEIKSKY